MRLDFFDSATQDFSRFKPMRNPAVVKLIVHLHEDFYGSCKKDRDRHLISPSGGTITWDLWFKAVNC